MEQRSITVEDLLALALQAAALSIGKEREIWFTEEPATLHTTLKGIRDHYRAVFPELAELSFSGEGAFPYSPEVRQILGNLQLDGVIGRRNPSFDRFSPNIFSGTEQVVREEIKSLFEKDPNRLKAFKQLVEELKKKLLVKTE